MNQAQSRRLRMRCLLLLAPLLVAGTPSPLPITRGLVLTTLPSRLVFLPLPEEIVKNQCVPVTVEARDSSGAPAVPGNSVTLQLSSSLLGGSFFASDTCQQSTISSVILPGNSQRVQVWFRATALGLVTLTASDGLLGMADALSLPLSVVINPTASLAFRNVPSSATAGQPINVTVEARDALGFVATGYSGTIQFTSTDPSAVLPRSYTFDPATDSGRKVFPVTFQTGGTQELVVEDTSNSNLKARVSNIAVQASEAISLEIVNLPPDTFRGTPLSFRVLALDANRNPGSFSGRLHFTSDDAGAVLPPDDVLQPSYTVSFDTPGTRTLTVTDLTPSSTLTTTARITVYDVQSRSVVVTASSTRLPTCSRVTLTLDTSDASTEAVTVSLCRPSDRAATIVDSSFGSVTTGPCVTGTFVGSATVVWADRVGEDVPFTLFGAESNTPITVSWSPEPKLDLASFVFRDTSEDIPKLTVSAGEKILQLHLSDTCPQPLVLPPDKELSFSATPPLSISTSYNPDTPGQWLVSVKLPECPEDPSKPLAIWPTIDGRDLPSTSGGRLERLVQPRCALAAELAIASPNNGEKVEPGGLVELEVELSNKSQQPILNGLLMVSAQGLTVLEARLDGEPLASESGGFLIPELRPDATVKVKVKAQATTNLEQTLNAKVRYVDADGTEIAPPKQVELSLGGLGVNVGCGCHAASLPSQLVPWLALLLAASRPWDRSRRLRRGERIGR